MHFATTSLTTRDPVVTSHNLSRPGGYNSAPTAAKRRHTDPPNNHDNGTAHAQHNQPRPRRQPLPATSKRHKTRSHTRTEQTKDNLHEAVSSSTAYPDAIPVPQQHLMPQERELARLQLNNHILMWQRKHGPKDQHPNPTVDRQPNDAATVNHDNRATSEKPSPPRPPPTHTTTSAASSPLVIQSRTPSPTSPAYDRNSPP